MKEELRKYSASELRDAYYEKQREIAETESLILPTEYYPYETARDKIDNKSN